MKNKVILLTILCLSIAGYAQQKYIADSYFNDYAYKKSAELYEKIYKKNDTNDYLVVSRLADSYYFNSETEKAAIWYEKLIHEFGKEVSKKHFLRYAQVLRSIGNYKNSDAILKEQSVNLEEIDPTEDLLSTHYISQFTYDTTAAHIKIHNVAINTPYSDFGGFLYNNTFYFSSSALKNKRKSKKYKWNNQPYLNLYTATLADTVLNRDTINTVIKDLKSKQVVSKRINTKQHEASLVITKDGKTMYFTRTNYTKRRARNKKESTAMLKIYKATLINNEWRNITKLPFNSKMYSVGHPALSLDEKTLYFVSDMKGGFGNTDIYRVAILNNNKFGKPENLGTKVNTAGREMFPFIGSENMLYFSSDGYKGFGGLDIYEVQLEENDQIGLVKKLKAPFNSNLDDFGFVVDANIQKGFFSSNRAGGKGDDDIYSFSIDKPSILEAQKVKETKIQPIVLQDTIQTSLPVVNTSEAIEQTIRVERQRIKDVLITNNEIVTSPINFDFDSSIIKKEIEPALDKVVKVLEENPELIIKIESHTDSRGSKDYNKKLSDKRAEATRSYIISKGIAIDRIESAIGYGEEKLLYSCANGRDEKCNEEVHQKNRRSYFYIINKNKKSSSNLIQDTITKNTKTAPTIDKQAELFAADTNLSINKNRIVTNPIYFNFNKHFIRKDARLELERVVEIMKEHPEMIIRIESHTDSRGSSIYNKKLSNKRAIATREYIISKGIASKRIESAIGYGEEKLLNNCNDANQKKCSNDAHQLNRRSYFYIVKNKRNRVSNK